MSPATTLPSDTTMGRVGLVVGDLDAMTRFYRDVLLLEVLEQGTDSVSLGRRGPTGAPDVLVTLNHRPDLPKGERRSAGLFHTALLHQDAAGLATALASVAVHAPQLFTGAGDHHVSQAFYLDDPEGNGVELYVDRPREHWLHRNGRIFMTTEYIDPHAFLAEHLTDAGRDLVETAPDQRRGLASLGAQVVGHVHLKVGSTAEAKSFYVDKLGFEVTAEVPGALFVSAGGYHHHLAMNTWQSEGVGLRAPGLGLGLVTVQVPSYALVRMAEDGVLRDAGAHEGPSSGAEVAGALELLDPWGNLVRIQPQAS